MHKYQLAIQNYDLSPKNKSDSIMKIIDYDIIYLSYDEPNAEKNYNDLIKGKKVWSSTALRIWNEVATLLLVIIVFLVVLKNSMNWIYGTIGFFGVAVSLMLAIKLYKVLREKSK